MPGLALLYVVYTDLTKTMRFEYHTILNIPIVPEGLTAYLAVPENSYAIIIFSFGSSTHNFNDYLHKETTLMHKNGLGTLLFNPLSETESSDCANRFNANLLADRLVAVARWLRLHKSARKRKIGLFGTGAGAIAALIAGAKYSIAKAIVCRDGKLKPQVEEIESLKTPTLLIAGESDEQSVEIQQWIFRHISCRKELYIIEGATHYSDIEAHHKEMISLTLQWFSIYLARRSPKGPKNNSTS